MNGTKDMDFHSELVFVAETTADKESGLAVSWVLYRNTSISCLIYSDTCCNLLLCTKTLAILSGSFCTGNLRFWYYVILTSHLLSVVINYYDTCYQLIFFANRHADSLNLCSDNCQLLVFALTISGSRYSSQALVAN